MPQTTFTTISPDPLRFINEVSYKTCATPTAFGWQDSDRGYAINTNDNLVGTVKDSTGTSLLLMPIPKSKHILSISGDATTIYKDFSANITTHTQPNGSIYHQLKPGTDSRTLRDEQGAAINFADIRYSDNGAWLVGDIANQGMTRVNIETGEMITFGDTYSYRNGLIPRFVMSISGDGRYIFAAEGQYEIMKLYDMNTCKPSTNQPKKHSCQSKDLLTEVRSQIPNFRSVHHIQFSTSTTLRFYAAYGASGDPVQYGLFSMTAHGEIESLIDYLATGDSFASGEGVYNYKPYTDIENPFNKCHLSIHSYPYLIHARTSLSSSQSVACSGARMKDMGDSPLSKFFVDNDTQAAGKMESSFDASIYADYLVGYRPQINFIEKNKPAKVTISIGGNDMGFGEIVKACVAPGTCYKDNQKRTDLIHTINQTFDGLVATYSRARDSAASGAPIYVIGYPLMVLPGGDCALNVRLDREELQFVNDLTQYINRLIARAAAKAGVTYINVEDAFIGHRLCEAKSNNLAVNGITLGDDKTASLNLPDNYILDLYLIGRESYHPNRLGHKLLADSILSQTNQFTSANPDPLPSTSNPKLTDSTHLINTASALPKRIVHGSNIIPGVVLAGSSHKLNLHGLRSNTIQTTIIYSPDRTLATYSTSTNSSQQSTEAITIPIDTEPGIYTIEAVGKTNSGETISLQKVIYIAASVDDIDGDGILNNQEQCLAYDASGTDLDNNQQDDTCDNHQLHQSTLLVSPIKNEQNTNIIRHVNRPVTPVKVADKPQRYWIMNIKQPSPPALSVNEPQVLSNSKIKDIPINLHFPSESNDRSVILLVIAVMASLIIVLQIWRAKR